jgi:peptide/nickel transport system substrate-binding protein/oligopeptide transport system substrate-binding protein
VRFDPETTEPYNYLATDISTEDNKTWTITIKDGTTFHNGEAVDAESFARSWNYAAYGPNAMANNYFFERIEGYDEMQGEVSEDDDGNVTVEEEPQAEELSGVKVVDATTLEVTLAEPFAAFDSMLGYTAFFPMAQACLDDIDACAVKPIGNGPFEVEEWAQGQSLSANKYADYTGEETPDFDRIEWTEYSGDSSWADFQADILDFGSPPPAQSAAASEDPDLADRRVEREGAALTYIGFPMYEGAPYDDIEFRKAISMAIDREAVIEAVKPGEAVPADSWVAPDAVPGGQAGVCGEYCTFDPEAAKEALEKAGGWPEGETLTIHLGQDQTEQEYFQAIGDQITLNLGIPYELDPSPDFFSRRTDRDFDGPWRANWFPDYPLNENYLAPIYASGGEDKSELGYYNEDFEKKMAEGDAAATPDEAVAKYAEAEKIIAEDFPTIPISVSNTVQYHSDRVSNVVLDPFSGQPKLRLLKVE